MAIKDIKLQINNFQMLCQVMITLLPKDQGRLVVHQVQSLELRFNKMSMPRIQPQESKKFFSHSCIKFKIRWNVQIWLFDFFCDPFFLCYSSFFLCRVPKKFGKIWYIQKIFLCWGPFFLCWVPSPFLFLRMFFLCKMTFCLTLFTVFLL